MDGARSLFAEAPAAEILSVRGFAVLPVQIACSDYVLVSALKARETIDRRKIRGTRSEGGRNCPELAGMNATDAEARHASPLRAMSATS